MEATEKRERKSKYTGDFWNKGASIFLDHLASKKIPDLCKQSFDLKGYFEEWAEKNSYNPLERRWMGILVYARLRAQEIPFPNVFLGQMKVPLLRLDDSIGDRAQLVENHD